MLESGKQSTRNISQPRYYVQSRDFSPPEEFSEHSLQRRELDTSRYDFFVGVWKSLFGICLTKTLRLVKIWTIPWSLLVSTWLISTIKTNELDQKPAHVFSLLSLGPEFVKFVKRVKLGSARINWVWHIHLSRRPRPNYAHGLALLYPFPH